MEPEGIQGLRARPRLSRSATGQVAAPNDPAASTASIGFLRATLLVMGSWCTVLAAGALAPVLPQMRATFAATNHVDLLIGFVATAPSLAVALFAIPIGYLSDRIGLRPVFLGGLLLFGISGVIPVLFLDTLPQIIVARFVTGLGEAAVMTASTALIGLMTLGATRSRLLAAQAVSANVLGIGVLLGGGAAGLLGWRIPFLAYAFGLIIFMPAYFTIRPAQVRDKAPAPQAASGFEPAPGAITSMYWSRDLVRLLAETCLLVAWSTIALYAVILQIGFLLVERGAANSAAVGMGQAIAASGIALGALLGGLLTRVSVRVRLTMVYALIAIGFVLATIVTGQLATSISAALAGIGCGLVIPTLLSRLLGITKDGLLGRVTGIWVSAVFFAQFASPPVFLFLQRQAGSLSGAFGVFAALSTLVALIVMMRNPPSYASASVSKV